MRSQAFQGRKGWTVIVSETLTTGATLATHRRFRTQEEAEAFSRGEQPTPTAAPLAILADTLPHRALAGIR